MNANGSLTTNESYYWERSRDYYTSDRVCIIGRNGYAWTGSGYGQLRGLAPAFVIGNGTFPAKITQNGVDITDKVKELIAFNAQKPIYDPVNNPDATPDGAFLRWSSE